MKIQLDDNNVITSYANIGDIENSIEISDDQIPNGFYDYYKRGYYKYDANNQTVVKNEDYEEDYNISETSNNQNVSNVDKLDSEELKKLMLMVSQVQKLAVQNAMANEKLLKQNAQLTKEITQLKTELNGGN